MPEASKTARKELKAKTLLTEVLRMKFFQGEDPAIPHLLVPSKSRVTLLLGENASGKSFIRRLVHAMCSKHKVECIPLSMEGRSAAGVPWKGLIYGAEEYRSTGENSVSTVGTAFRTAEKRADPHVLFFDEPDIGLSDSWAAGLGQKMARFCRKLPALTTAVYVVTHSRPLVEQLVAVKPNYLHVGTPTQEAPQSLQEWLSRPILPRDPEELKELSHQRFQKIQALLQK